MEEPTGPEPAPRVVPTQVAHPQVVHKEVDVPLAPARAFAAFTEDIGRWWPMATHSVHGERASVAFEGDRLLERLGPQEATWAEVVEWDPPRGLRLAWHPGRPAEEATDLVVAFRPHDDPHPGGTRVVLDHSGWERLGRPDAATSYEEGWDLVLGRWVAAVAGQVRGAGAAAGS